MINRSRPAFVYPGALVWYEARAGVKFAAVVEGEPREEPDGWIVDLVRLGDDFARWSGRDSHYVSGIELRHLSPRDEDPDDVITAKGDGP